MTNAREQEDEKMTNMPLLETRGNSGNSNEQPSKKFSPMAKSQLMKNYFLVGQEAVLSNICQTNLQNLASSFGYCVK